LKLEIKSRNRNVKSKLEIETWNRNSKSRPEIETRFLKLEFDAIFTTLLLLAMRDMNVAKLTSTDLPLFNAITNDLFPGVDLPTLEYGQFKTTIEKELLNTNMQVTDNAVRKVIQLYETKNSRHSTMIVGATNSGKSVTWKTLAATLTTMKKSGDNRESF